MTPRAVVAWYRWWGARRYHAAESYTAVRALCGVALPTLPAWTMRDAAEVTRAGKRCCARCLKSA